MWDPNITFVLSRKRLHSDLSFSGSIRPLQACWGMSHWYRCMLSIYLWGLRLRRAGEFPALLLQHFRGAACALLGQREQLAAAWGASAEDRAALSAGLTRLMVRSANPKTPQP